MRKDSASNIVMRLFETRDVLLSKNEERRLKLINYISIISFFSELLFVVYYALINYQLFFQLNIILSIASIGFLIPIVFNKLKLYFLAKLFLATYNSTLILFIVLFYFGKEPGVHSLFLIFGIIPIFIWSSKQRVYPILIFTINLIGYSYIEFFMQPFSYHLVFPVEYIDLTRSLSILVSFLGATATVVIFHRLADKNEKKLQGQKEKIEQQKSLLLKLNKELSEKIEELNHSNMVKGKIYSVIAHDLRCPLTSIISLLNLIVEKYEEFDKNAIRNYIVSIQNTSQNTFALLENLLDWARMQTGRITVVPENVRLKPITEKAVLLSIDSIKKKNVTISNQINNNLVVQADRYMLSTILRNLISNAIKFTHQHGSIVINTNNSDIKKIEINIADTGVGMTKNEVEGLFNIDNNFTNVGTDNEKGTGLGLLICKEFVEKNGGSISVKSTKNKGSVFSFSVNKVNP